MRLSEWMIPELASEAAMTRSLLALIPEDKLDFSPTAQGQKTSQDNSDWSPGAPSGDFHSIRWNASHLVEILGWLPGIVNKDSFELEAADSADLPHAADVGKLLAKFDDNLAAATTALRGVSDDVMDEPWSLKMGGQALFTMKKGDCLRKWVFSHTAHHRGILTVYLRLAGVKVPSVYEG